MRSYLKKLRKEKHLTQQDVADRLGLAQNSYSMIESGERQKRMSIDMAQKLSSALDVPIDAILKNENIG
ncbi:MAG: helix-turn-helix transcriptional regulator [Clostridia bacterium]|nr:helix-turn-helix transcriptional regulator [Clostridia bacterium]